MTLDEVDTTRPVAMYLARRRRGGHRYVLVALDLDAKRAGRTQVLADAAALANLLTAHSIPCVPAASGPSGGMHLWTACPEGLAPAVARRIGETAATLYPTLDAGPLTNPLTGVLRPPGAPHRHGGYSRLTQHTPAEAIAALKTGAPAAAYAALLATLEAMAGAPALLDRARAAAVGPVADRVRHRGQLVPGSITARGPVVRPVTQDEHGRVRLATPWRPLGDRALSLVQRRPKAQPGAHSAAVHPVLRTLALLGWTYQQAADLAADPQLAPALEWLRTTDTGSGRSALTAEKVARRMERCWWLAVQDAARMPRRPTDDGADDDVLSPAGEASADLLARVEAAGPERWSRPSGPSDRATLRAVAHLMATTGAEEPTVNVRRLAVLIGRSKSTAALALNRTTADGWFETAAAADLEAGTARRVRLAQAHECPADEHHVCAVYELPTDAPASQKTPGHYGSDRRRNAAAPLSPLTLFAQLSHSIAHQQSGLWHALGHHAGRTLEYIQQGASLAELTTFTGYTAATITRHVRALARLDLISLHRGDHGPTIVRTARTLYEAAAECGTATRPAELATAGRVDQARHAWWRREVEWSRLSRTEKRQRGRRADARQLVLAGMDPHARAYPRHHDGNPDHATAWDLEAARINAAQLAIEADQLAQAGHVVDPAHLGRHVYAAEPDAQKAAA